MIVTDSPCISNLPNLLYIHLLLPFEGILPEAFRFPISKSILLRRMAFQRFKEKRRDRIGCYFILAEMMIDRKSSALDEEIINLIMSNDLDTLFKCLFALGGLLNWPVGLSLEGVSYVGTLD